MLAAGLSPRPAARIGPAFHYQAIFSRESEAWYTRFPILVTGNILDELQSRALKVNGTKLVAYTWSSAFYPGDAISAPPDWQSMVQKHRGAWLLNDRPLGGGSAAAGRLADWYDFGNPDLIAAHSRFLADRLSASGYDGFFLDTLGFEHLPPAAQDEFRNRHSGLDYNRAQGTFLGALRNRLSPGSLIFTNQAYRHATDFSPYADLDLSESYFTATGSDGSTIFKKWRNPETPWDSVRRPMEELIAPVSRRYPRVRFVHLNYATGDPKIIRRAITYSSACAKLFNHDAYLVAPGSEAQERHEIYFTGLGRPVTASYRELTDQGVAWREYEKGIVAINSGNSTAEIRSPRLTLADPPRGYFFR